MEQANFSDLVGVTLARVDANVGGDAVRLEADDGRAWMLYHSQDCCESVEVEDIAGDLSDLVGSPIVLAEESSSEGKNPEGVTPPSYQDSFTWTFYRIGTARGTVVIRWYGESNGYYSERVSFRALA